MQQQLFDHVNIAFENTCVPNGLAADVDCHCREYETKIQEAGGVDLQLLGIGHNGHIAFNEPGSPLDSRTRSVELTSETIEQNARFFDSPDQVPRHAITMGIQTILEARQIVLLALGEGKSDAIEETLFGPVTDQLPASALQLHSSVTIVLDAALRQRHQAVGGLEVERAKSVQGLLRWRSRKNGWPNKSAVPSRPWTVASSIVFAQKTSTHLSFMDGSSSSQTRFVRRFRRTSKRRSKS